MTTTESRRQRRYTGPRCPRCDQPIANYGGPCRDAACDALGDFPKAGTSENKRRGIVPGRFRADQLPCAQPLAAVAAFRSTHFEWPARPTYHFRVVCGSCGFDVTTNYRDDANTLAADHNNQGGQK